MDYLTVKDLSEQWKVSERQILSYINSGKISGAEKFGGAWLIPLGVEKPVDHRVKIKQNQLKNVVRLADSFKFADEIDNKSLDLIVTSPPYWAKRTYSGNDEKNELGLEDTPDLYIKHLVRLFDIYKPKLKDTGNLFVNMGDTFFGSGAGAWSKYLDKDGNVTKEQKDRKESYFTTKPLQPKIKQDGKLYQNKQLMLIPSRFAIAMQEAGWILRDDIIWHKPNRIPASVKDRLNNTYEHVFHFVQQRQYYFDLDSIKIMGSNHRMKNPGDVWDINTQPVKGHHTATFPEELIRRIVLCASPEHGVVNDPFLGTGTTWLVANRYNRNFVGSEISKEYFELAQDRFYSMLPI